MNDSIVNELCQEATITRRILERVPGDRLEWKPHPKEIEKKQGR